MWAAPEIQELFAKEEPFYKSRFAYSDEYNALSREYFALYTTLEEILDEKSFAILEKMIRCQEGMEEVRARHHFQEGVLISKNAEIMRKPIDFLILR